MTNPQVTVTEIPAGYHLPTVTEFSADQRSWNIACAPFTVQYVLTDQFGTVVPGIPFTVSINGTETEQIETGNKPLALSDSVHPGDVLRITPVQEVDGYLLSGTEFTIPTDNEENYVISLTCQKYLHYQIHLQDEEYPLGDKEITIFKDEEGTETAQDINGQELHGITDADGNYSFSTFPGSYYVQEKVRSSGHVAMPVTKISASSTITIPRTVLHVQIPAKGVKCSLMEDGRLIKEWTTDGEDAQISGLLEEGKEYELHCQSTGNVFLAEPKKKFRFTDQQNLELIAVPYIPCTAAKDSSTFGIFLDEACEHMANDVYGNPALSLSNQSIAMRAGQYWLKELNCDTKYRLDETAYELDLKPEDTEVIIALQAEPAGVVISTVNGSGEPLAGINMTIYDDSGNVVKQYESNGTDTLITEELERGKRYYVSPDNGKTGGSLEVPEQEYGTAVVRKSNKSWYYFVPAAVIGLYFLYRVLRKQKQNH